MSDKFKWSVTSEYTEYIIEKLVQKAYNRGQVAERVRIIKRLKDNLKPSVYDTVIRIIHAA